MINLKEHRQDLFYLQIAKNQKSVRKLYIVQRIPKTERQD